MNHLKPSADTRSLPLVSSVVAALFCAALTSQEGVVVLSPELEAPTPLRTVDGKVIESNDWCVPTVADIDGDGKQDLVVGQFMNHKVKREDTERLGSAGTARWYRNSAASGAATYAPGVDLKCDDGPLYAANW